MYRNTSDKKYLDIASQIVYSILKTDVHNTGAFSTDEKAIGNPYINSVIETCCVVAYNALAIEIFLLTGDIKIVDFLERSHYNAVLGYYSPTGRWSTYNTPMDGSKCANYHSITFQCRPGSPDLNCCSVNAPRGVANIAEWMITKEKDGLFLNFYEDMQLETKDGIRVKISGSYPANNNVTIYIDSKNKKEKLSFRIPTWSKNRIIKINEETFCPKSGTYFSMNRVWNDDVHIQFDFTPYIEDGADDCDGKSSIFIGPVLYGLDIHDNPIINYDNIPCISKSELNLLVPVAKKDGSICLETSNGIVLKDFYHLGVSGSLYKTWLEVR